MTRSHDSFPNCLQTQRQIPVKVQAEPVLLTIDIPNDLVKARDRLRAVNLWLHLDNLTVEDQVAVELNGVELACANPMCPGGYDPTPDTWLRFDLLDYLPVRGSNSISVRMAAFNARLAKEIPVELADLELEVRYEYPDGEWRRSPGWHPRT